MATSPNLTSGTQPSARSQFGLNLDEVADWTSAPMFRDRMLFARAPTAVDHLTPICAYDPDTGLPSEAGSLGRAIPLDPITNEQSAPNHTYVLITDGNVESVGTPWGTMHPDANGRAFLTSKSSSDGVGLAIKARGPVKKFHFMRVEHEQGFLQGDMFNPDYLKRAAPFPILRPLDLVCANDSDTPAQRPRRGDGYFSAARGGIPAELLGELAKRQSSKLWYPIHPKMTVSNIIETAMALAVWGVDVDFEDGNELGWSYHSQWLRTATAAKYGLASVNYFDELRFYGFQSGNLAKLVSSVSPRFKVNLASQASNGASNLPYILKGWDESGAPRSLIAGYANGNYLNLNSKTTELVDLMHKDDKPGFVRLLDSLRPELLARHVKEIGVCKSLGIKYKCYEGGPSLYTSRPIFTDNALRFALQAWAGPLFHTPEAAAVVAAHYRDVKNAGADEVLHYKMSGRGSENGTWGLLPHISLNVYPLYNMLTGRPAGSV